MRRYGTRDFGALEDDNSINNYIINNKLTKKYILSKTTNPKDSPYITIGENPWIFGQRTKKNE